jgi:hypothetical protein
MLWNRHHPGRLAALPGALLVGALLAAPGALAEAAPTLTVDLVPAAKTKVVASANVTAQGKGTAIAIRVHGLKLGTRVRAILRAGTCHAPSASFASIASGTVGSNATALLHGTVRSRGTDPVAFDTVADGSHTISVLTDAGVIACGRVPGMD